MAVGLPGQLDEVLVGDLAAKVREGDGTDSAGEGGGEGDVVGDRL